ncbi:MAG: DUF4170 domain-containing protein [Sphingobium sp.]|nr:DUF4170 domain-containing protein [Sphingobium sp.]
MGASHVSQLLHLVMGGRVKDPKSLEFVNLKDIDLVGVFPNYASAEAAWRAAAQRTVDDAEMRYVVVHLHRLLDPETGETHMP